MRLAIARALNKYNPEERTELKKAGFLTRDARAVERKKAGLHSSRTSVLQALSRRLLAAGSGCFIRRPEQHRLRNAPFGSFAGWGVCGILCLRSAGYQSRCSGDY